MTMVTAGLDGKDLVIEAIHVQLAVHHLTHLSLHTGQKSITLHITCSRSHQLYTVHHWGNSNKKGIVATIYQIWQGSFQMPLILVI